MNGREPEQYIVHLGSYTYGGAVMRGAAVQQGAGCSRGSRQALARGEPFTAGMVAWPKILKPWGCTLGREDMPEKNTLSAHSRRRAALPALSCVNVIA